MRFEAAVIGDAAHMTLEEGKKYLVYRKNPETGEPTYSICIYRNGGWVPEVFVEMNIMGFTAFPILPEDKFIDLDQAFKVNQVKKSDKKQPEIKEPDVNTMSCSEYVNTRAKQHELEDKQHFKELIERYKQDGLPVPKLDPDMKSFIFNNDKVNSIIDYIDKRMVDGPMIEKNWEHLKNFTNEILNRVIELEKTVENMPRPLIPLGDPGIFPDQIGPCFPPSCPQYPEDLPIITYSAPGVGISKIPVPQSVAKVVVAPAREVQETKK